MRVRTEDLKIKDSILGTHTQNSHEKCWDERPEDKFWVESMHIIQKSFEMFQRTHFLLFEISIWKTKFGGEHANAI